LDFTPGKHHRTLMPSEIVQSRNVKSIVAYTAKKEEPDAIQE